MSSPAPSVKNNWQDEKTFPCSVHMGRRWEFMASYWKHNTLVSRTGKLSVARHMLFNC